jgi:hypothetical protein
VEAGAVADDRERGHALAEGDGMEPHERRARARPRSRRPAQPLPPTRRVLQPSQPPPQEYRRRRRAARRPVQLVQRQASARRQGRRTGRQHWTEPRRKWRRYQGVDGGRSTRLPCCRAGIPTWSLRRRRCHWGRTGAFLFCRNLPRQFQSGNMQNGPIFCGKTYRLNSPPGTALARSLPVLHRTRTSARRTHSSTPPPAARRRALRTSASSSPRLL